MRQFSMKVASDQPPAVGTERLRLTGDVLEVTTVLEPWATSGDMVGG